MEKSKTYYDVRFDSDVIREAVDSFTDILCAKSDIRVFNELRLPDGTTYQFDSIDEYLADFRRPGVTGRLRITCGDSVLRTAYYDLYNVHQQHVRGSDVTVAAKDRPKIERIFEIFEKNVVSSTLPAEPKIEAKPPTVFIGHGGSPQWRDLNHLHEKHDFPVSAYEIGARAGHVIRDILEDMLKKASFALLVMTAEDEMTSGEMRPRENVVHEAGLFQGRLGFDRAIVLVEDGVEPFSNLQGVHQIRYPAGAIAHAYGEVLATLRREFQR